MLTNLDLLRSFAVLAVLFAHWALTLSGNGPGERLVGGVDVYSIGFSGVLIFFVHTSLVLMKSLQRSGEFGGRLFGAFYVRRIFRIYPLSVLLCLAVVTFGIPRNVLGIVYEWPGKTRLLGNLTLIQNLLRIPSLSDPMWSLPYEVQMYLLLPAIFLFLRTERWGMRFAALIGVGTAVARSWSPAAFMPNFLCGVLAFCIMQGTKPRWPAWLWPPFVLVTMATYWTFTRLHEDSFIASIALCLMLGAAIPFFRDTTNRPARIIAKNVAKYSYGIYLCHYPLMWFFYRKLSGLATIERHLGFIVCLILFPVLCYHLVEHPLIKLGMRLAAQRSCMDRDCLSVSQSVPPP
jgi:peptidoglycan/LPS O-acetylase OafA/YrhL